MGPVMGKEISGANHIVERSLNGQMPGYPNIMWIPNVIVRIAAVFSPEFRPVAADLNYVKKVSNEKARRVLDWQPRSSEDTIIASTESMIAKSLVKD